MTLSEKIEIPLFPLSVCLLPGERMTLHIFEPRYRQLFAELNETESVFGIPYIEGALKKSIGSRCRLIEVVKTYTSGESDVLIECDGLFRLEDFQSMKEDKLYPYGTVTLLRSMTQERISSEVQEAYEHFCAALVGSELHYHEVDSEYTLAVIASLNLMSDEKYKLLSAVGAEQRDARLLQMIKMLSVLVEQEKAMEQGLYMS